MNNVIIPNIKSNNKYFFFTMKEWYKYYEQDLKYLFVDFLKICRNNDIIMHSNNESFNFFVRFLYYNSHKIKTGSNY